MRTKFKLSEGCWPFSKGKNIVPTKANTPCILKMSMSTQDHILQNTSKTTGNREPVALGEKVQ